jgi:hypothetical protein
VVNAFLGIPGFTLRGVTRNRDKPESLALEKKGVEIVVADIADQDSLRAALAGAHIVFGNTAYPAEEAMKPGMQQRAYELELQQGKNIADAVSTVRSLELFIWSSLSAASKWSEGQYRKVWHFDSKAHVVDYIHANHPRLAKKMSILQMGLFVDNWKNGPILVPWDKVRATTTYTLLTFNNNIGARRLSGVAYPRERRRCISFRCPPRCWKIRSCAY